MELSVILLMSGLVVAYMLTVVQATDPRGPECIVNTRDKLMTIRGAVERFARTKDRLPLPAARNLPADSPLFGRESSGANIDTASGVSFGALPWQALGLQVDYAGDCWGNKFTYMVTTALTTNASSGGYLDSTVEGNITLKTGAGVTTAQTKLAYAIISHGEDQLGAVKVNWSAANPSHGWCSGSANIAYTNCLASGAEIMDAAFNNAKDAGTNYFDDLVIAAARPKILSSTKSFVYGWGFNSAGVLNGNYRTLSPKKVATSHTFSSISLSDSGCALDSGAAYCWGRNEYGQLGNGTTVLSYTASAVSGGLTFTQISTGNQHACGLTSTNDIYCWGRNGFGQLGDGTTTNSSVPVKVGGGYTFTKMDVGGDTTCGLTNSNDLYCWGSNAYGQLGAGIAIDGSAHSTPLLVSGYTFTTFSAGATAVCAINTTNDAYCWGYGLVGVGQLGYSATPTSQTAPVAVAGGYKFSSISNGNGNTCGLTAAGAVYCWGTSIGDGTSNTNYTPVLVSGTDVYTAVNAGTVICGILSSGAANCWNGNGYVGDGTLSARYSPTAVSGGLTFSSIEPAVSGAGKNVCGITVGGETYCWGDKLYGQTLDSIPQYDAAPMPLNGGVVFSTISGGYDHSCGLDSAGAAYCWGGNSNGQIGNGVTGGTYSSPTAVSGGLQFSKITLGVYHTCGITTSGAAYCWGQNARGQLGINSVGATNYNTPQAVVGPGGGAALTFSDISTYGGGNATHTCALTAAGAAYCWGNNQYGQVGDGTTTASPYAKTTPTLVSGGRVYTKLSVGGSHTCGITSSNAAYCWGYGGGGVLGNGATSNSNVPVAVSGGYSFTTIVAGYSVALMGYGHSCALTTSGDAYCWGNGTTYGQLGTGFSGNSTTPVAVTGGLKFSSISSAGLSTCGLTSAGATYCWGYSGLGSAGNSNYSTPQYSPVAVTGGLAATAISSGNGFFYLLNTNSSYCSDLWSAGYYPNNYQLYAYQSAAPTGHCVAEWRTCTNGSWTGSYTQQSCTPGCDARTVTWGTTPACSGPMPALAGGGSTSVNSTSGGTGSVTASCSTSGVVTLSGASCS